MKMLYDSKEVDFLFPTAIRGLGQFGSDAAMTIPDLIRVWENVDWAPPERRVGLRQMAGFALVSIGPRDARVLAALQQVLKNKSESWWVRMSAAGDIGRMGEYGKVASGDIIATLREVRDKNTVYKEADIAFPSRTFVQMTLIRAIIGLQDSKAAPVLVEIVKEEKRHHHIREDALNALRKIKGVAPQQILELLPVLETAGTPTELRQAIVEMIGGLGPSALEAVPVLLRLSDAGESPAMAQALERALKRIQNK
jgi:HEAT repeat protein